MNDQQPSIDSVFDAELTPEQEADILRHQRDETAIPLLRLPDLEPLRVVRVAILDDHGGVHSVPRPGRHHDVIAKMVEAGLPKPITGEQGFVLSDGRFVRRKGAARIAINAGQCKTVRCPGIGLMSEDVW